MKKRRMVALGMTAAMVAGTLAGCGGNSTTSNTGNTGKAENEIVNITIHSGATEQADNDEVMEALNEYTAEKIGVTCNWVFHGGSYADKIQTIIASGEEYDACFTSNWLNPYNTNVAKGAFLDISEMLPEVAPDLYETLPDYMWDAVKVNGGIYAVPNQQIVARQIGALMPKEFVEGTGTDISTIKNLTDMGEYAQKAYDQFGGLVGGVNIAQASDYCGYEYVSDYLSAGVIKMDDESAKVVNFYETDEWINMLNELVALNDKGLLDGECGYMPDYNQTQRLAKKTSAFYSGTYKPGVEAEESAVAGYDCVFATAGGEPYISTGSVVATMYGISTTSKHPEETLKYLELLSTDSTAINLISFGIEGEHYEKIDDNTVRVIADGGYVGQSWQFGNVFNSYVTEGQPADVWEQTEALNNSAKTSPILGFSFNPEPVQTEIANVSTVVKQYESLVGGELPVEETNAEFVDQLKVAGVDTIIAEMQKQIDEFLASK